MSDDRPEMLRALAANGKLAKMEQVNRKLDVLEKKVNRTYKPNVRRRHQRKR